MVDADLDAAGDVLIAPRFDNQDGTTWSGDVGQAIIYHHIKGQAKGNSHAQSFDEWASKGDLNADLDGFVLGHNYDKGEGLTEQLQSYYLDPQNTQGYERRYSQFCDLRGLDIEDDKQLTGGAKGEIKEAVDSFSRLFAFGQRSEKEGIFPHDSKSDTTKDMNLYFEKYLEEGLQKESKSTE